jgi:hypothetical protein
MRAMATARFQDAITARAGVVIRQRAATWLWRYAEKDWRILYGHVDHYTDTST